MFKKSFSSKGRIRRTEYGLSILACSIIYGIVKTFGKDELEVLEILYFPMYWFLLTQGAKRCHDLGHNGFWQFIPFYGFALLFQDGQIGSNQYGENPKIINENNEI